MYKLYALLLTLCLGSGDLFAAEFFISSEYMEYHKPLLVMVHDAAGNVLHHQKIRPRNYQRTLTVEFEHSAEVGEKLILTTISLRINKGKESFFNQSFYDVKDGYTLNHEETRPSLEGAATKFRDVKVLNIKKFGVVEKISQKLGSTEWRQESVYPGALYLRFGFPEDRLSLITIQSSSSMWYYLFNPSDWDQRGEIVLNGDQFLPFENTQYINNPKEVHEYEVRVHLAHSAHPLFYRAILKSRGERRVIHIPDEIYPVKYDLRLTKVNEETWESTSYYLSAESLPDSISIPDWEHSASLSDNTFKLNTLGVPGFFNYGFWVDNDHKYKSHWTFWGAANEEVEFVVPEIPDEITRKNEYLLFDEVDRSLGFYRIFSSQKAEELEDLSSPFEIENADRLLLNNSLLIHSSFHVGQN